MWGSVLLAVTFLMGAIGFAWYSLYLAWNGDMFGWLQASLASVGCRAGGHRFMEWADARFPELAA